MNEQKPAQIDLGKVFSTIKRHILAIIIFSFVCAAITAAIVLSIPRYYKVSIELVPETAKVGGVQGALGALASMTGFKSSTGSEDALFPEVYPDIVKSNTFLVEMFDVQMKTLDDSIHTTLYDYYLNHQKQSWIDEAKNKIHDFINSFKDPSPRAVKSDKVDPFMLTKEQDDVAQAISGSIKCDVDKKTEIISITYQAQDPLVAALMADSVRAKLQDYIIEYRTVKARKDLEYTEKLLQEAEVAYKKAQKEYAQYCDTHKDIILQSYISEQERLENQLQLTYQTYGQLAQQVDLAKAKVQEITPAFAIVSPASVPFEPAGPKRMIITGAVGVLAFILAAVFFCMRAPSKEKEDKSKKNKKSKAVSEDDESALADEYDEDSYMDDNASYDKSDDDDDVVAEESTEGNAEGEGVSIIQS